MATNYIEEFQKFWEKMIQMQSLFLSPLSGTFESLQKFSIMQDNIAVFRAKIQSGGRISIPEPDRVALNLKEGDIVKVIVIKEGGDRNGV